MKIDLNRADGSTTSFDLRIPASDIELDSDLARIRTETEVSGSVTAGDPITVVEARVESGISIDCSRCLRELQNELQLDFKTAFVSSEELSDEQEVELDLQDLEVSFSDEDEIDLVDVVREQMILALPSRPLCSEDCKGLCEICGINLNEASCDCKQEETDPRWAALKNLK